MKFPEGQKNAIIQNYTAIFQEELKISQEVLLIIILGQSQNQFFFLFSGVQLQSSNIF